MHTLKNKVCIAHKKCAELTPFGVQMVSVSTLLRSFFLKIKCGGLIFALFDVASSMCLFSSSSV